MRNYVWSCYFTLKGAAMLLCGGQIATGGMVCLALVPLVVLLERAERRSNVRG